MSDARPTASQHKAGQLGLFALCVCNDFMAWSGGGWLAQSVERKALNLEVGIKSYGVIE